MHINKGKTIAQCLTARTAYALNPDKTAGGELVSAYQCNPQIVDAEFLLAKRQYRTLTGREPKNDVIAYQVRQSFKPGEISPEEANRIGYEFAMRFLKGNHAFIVATHIDHAHIHNHIIWNSTTLDYRHKFRDFRRSGMAVRQLSDIICLEHGLSIVENPQRHGQSYDRWQGSRAKLSNREMLRLSIDQALEKNPANMNELLELLQQTGYEIKRGKHIALRGPDQQRFMRLDSLKGSYTEEILEAVIFGKQRHRPRKRRGAGPEKAASLLVDIEEKLREGKGSSYIKWANNFNLKQMAQTLSYLTEHQLLAYSDLASAADSATARFHDLAAQIKSAEARMSEISTLRTHIINYAKTREVYTDYCKAGYSPKFLAAHEEEILLHKAAKKAFDELGVKKLPSVKNLQSEYAALLAEKKAAYGEYRKIRDEMRELAIHKANVDTLLGMKNERDTPPEKNQNQR
jgi:hypothetical protein